MVNAIYFYGECNVLLWRMQCTLMYSGNSRFYLSPLCIPRKTQLPSSVTDLNNQPFILMKIAKAVAFLPLVDRMDNVMLVLTPGKLQNNVS